MTYSSSGERHDIFEVVSYRALTRMTRARKKTRKGSAACK